MLLSFRLHQIILAIFACISAFGNALLISLILNRKSRDLGNYRWLLLAFAVVDIAISVYHAFVIPTYFSIEYGCVAFTAVSLQYQWPINFIINSFYCILFYEPFILLMFHFIFRYLTLFKSDAINSHPWRFALLALLINLVCSTGVVFSNLIQEANTRDDYFGADLFIVYGINTTTRPHLIQMNFIHSASNGGGVNWVTIGGIANSGIVAFSTLAVNAFCTVRILGELRSGGNFALSNKTRQLQLHLFRALIAQFLVPFILCFAPYLIIIVLPITGIRFGEIGNIIATFVSIFPALDAFLVILMVKRFRVIMADWFNIFTQFVNSRRSPYAPNSISPNVFTSDKITNTAV